MAQRRPQPGKPTPPGTKPTIQAISPRQAYLRNQPSLQGWAA